MSAELIGALWQSYRRSVSPTGASGEALEALRNAFYAGAGGTFAALLEASKSDDDEAAATLFEQIDAELQSFLAMAQLDAVKGPAN